MLLLLLALAFISSYVITMHIRKFALCRNIVDVPNHRSAHVNPTPRGGGGAIFLTFLIFSLLSYFLFGFIESPLIIVLLCSTLVALIGWLDDHGHVVFYQRLFIHLLAATLLVYKLGAVSQLQLGNVNVELGIAGYFITIITLIWLLNLYNFMDGINGLAGAEAVSVSLGMAILLGSVGDGSTLFFLWLIIAVASLGFLIWNFPKAKIFMGDIGSGFLGFTIGALLLLSALEQPTLLWCGFILLGVFITDATITLVKRALTKQVIYEAHSTHAYQHAARFFKSHTKVTCFVILINVFWLFPIAYIVNLGYLSGLFGLILAYIPLVYFACKFKAGQIVS